MESGESDVYNGNIEGFPDLEAPCDGYPSARTWCLERKDRDLVFPGSAAPCKPGQERFRRGKDRSLVITNRSVASRRPRVDSSHRRAVAGGSSVLDGDHGNVGTDSSVSISTQTAIDNVPSVTPPTSVSRRGRSASAISRIDNPAPSSSKKLTPTIASNSNNRSLSSTKRRPAPTGSNRPVSINNNMSASSSCDYSTSATNNVPHSVTNNVPHSATDSMPHSATNNVPHSKNSDTPAQLNVSHLFANTRSASTDTRSTLASKRFKPTSMNSRSAIYTRTDESATSNIDNPSPTMTSNRPTLSAKSESSSANNTSASHSNSGSTSASCRRPMTTSDTVSASTSRTTSVLASRKTLPSIANSSPRPTVISSSESTGEDSFSPTHMEFLTVGDSRSTLSYYYDILSHSIRPWQADKSLEDLASPESQDLASPASQDLASPASQEMQSVQDDDDSSDDNVEECKSGSDQSDSDCTEEITTSILFLNRGSNKGIARTPSTEFLIDNRLNYAPSNSPEALNETSTISRLDGLNNEVSQGSRSAIGESEINNSRQTETNLRSGNDGITRLSLSVTNPLYSSVVGLSDSSSENEAMAQSPSDCEGAFYSSSFESTCSSSSCQSRESLTNLKLPFISACGGSSNRTVEELVNRRDILQQSADDLPVAIKSSGLPQGDEALTEVKEPTVLSTETILSPAQPYNSTKVSELARGNSAITADSSRKSLNLDNFSDRSAFEFDSPREYKVSHKVNLGVSSLKCTFPPAKETKQLSNPLSGNLETMFVPSINFDRSRSSHNKRMPYSKSEYQIREANSALSQSHSQSRLMSRPLSDAGPHLLPPVSSRATTKGSELKSVASFVPASLSSTSERHRPLRISRSLSCGRRLSDPSPSAPRPPRRSASLGSTLLLARSLSEPHLANLNSYATDELRTEICRLESELFTIPHLTAGSGSNIPGFQGATSPSASQGATTPSVSYNLGTGSVPKADVQRAAIVSSSSSSDTEVDTPRVPRLRHQYHSSSSDSFDISHDTGLELPGLDSSDEFSPDENKETLESSDSDTDSGEERQERSSIWPGRTAFSDRVRIPAPDHRPGENGIASGSSDSDTDHERIEVEASDNYPGSSDSSSETMSVDALFTRLGIMPTQDGDADDEAGFQDSSDDEDEDLLLPVRRQDSPHPAAYMDGFDTSDSDGDFVPSIDALYENLGIMTRQDNLETSGSSIGPPRLPVRSSTDTDFLDFEILNLDDSLEHPPSYLDLFPAGMASLSEMPPSYDDAVRPVSIHQDHFDYATSHDHTAANNRLSLQLSWLPSSEDYRNNPPPAYDEAIFCVQGRPHEEVSYQAQEADNSVRRSRGRRILNGLRRFARKIFK